VKTFEIAQRIFRLKTTVRLTLIVMLTVATGVGGFFIGRMDSGDTAIATAAAGLVVGFFWGRFLGNLFAVTLDWRSQVLILNENILERLRTKTA